MVIRTKVVALAGLLLASALTPTPADAVPARGSAACHSVSVHYGSTVHLGSGVIRRPGSVNGVRVQVVSADLTKSSAKIVHAARLRPSGVTHGGVVAFAKQTRNALITVNGDYFLHGVPRGPLVDGSVLHMDLSAQAHPRALILDGRPSVQPVYLLGSLKIGPWTFPVTAVNSMVTTTGVLVYTQAWQGKTAKGYSFTVGPNRVVVSGSSERAIQAVQGKRSLLLGARTATGRVVRHAIGVGNSILARGIARCSPSTNINSSRTAVGWSADGKHFYVATAILNRHMAVRNRGLTGYQLARVLQAAGASEAVLLDGGGSTAMVQYRGPRNIAYTADRFIRPTVTGIVITRGR